MPETANRTSTTTEPEEKAPTVKYTGGAGVREITAAQWKQAGVEGQKTVVWDASNEYTVLASELNDAAREVIKRDRNLKISS